MIHTVRFKRKHKHPNGKVYQKDSMVSFTKYECEALVNSGVASWVDATYKHPEVEFRTQYVEKKKDKDNVIEIDTKNKE